MRIKIDSRGRVTIPAKVRRRLGLEGYVELTIEGARIVLSPVKERKGIQLVLE